MPVCPNKKSPAWEALNKGLKDKNPKKSDKEIEAMAYVAFFRKGDIPTVDEAVSLLFKGKTKKMNDEAKAAFRAFRFAKTEGGREKAREQKEFAARVKEYLSTAEPLRGALNQRQVGAIVRRAADIGTSEKSFKKFTDYFDKVVENANYEADLSKGKELQKKLTKPFADAADIIKRMKALPLDSLSAKDLLKFNEIAENYVASTKSPGKLGYEAFDVAKAETMLKPIEDSVRDMMIKEVEDAYNVIGLTKEEAKLYEDMLGSDDIDAFIDNLEEAKRKDLLFNARRIADYSQLGLKEMVGTMEQSLVDMYGKDTYKKMKKLSEAKIDFVTDPKELAFIAKTMDNMVVNQSDANITNALTMVGGAERASKGPEITSRIVTFKPGNVSRDFYKVPMLFKRIFGDRIVAGRVRSITGMDAMVTASGSAEKDAISKVKQWNKFKKDNKISNSVESDVIMGVYAHLNDVKKGSEDVDFIDNKKQIELSIDRYLGSTDYDDVKIGEFARGLYEESLKDIYTHNDFVEKFNSLYGPEVKGAKWVKENLWDEQLPEMVRHARQDLNEDIDVDLRENYHPRTYKKVVKTLELNDITEKMFNHDSLTPKETGRTKERRLKNTLPKNKVVSLSFEQNSFRVYQENLFTMRSYEPVKTFYYMSKNKGFDQMFGGADNAEFIYQTYKSMYDMIRYGKKQSDRLSRTVGMELLRASKNIGAAVALGRPTQYFSQSIVMINTILQNPKYTMEVVSKNIPSDLPLLNLAPIGFRDVEMGAVGRAEETQVLTYTKTKRKVRRALNTMGEVSSWIRETVLTPLVNADVTMSKKSFLAYYLKYMNDVAKIPTSAGDLATEHLRIDDVRREALSYAQQAVDETQSVSSRSMQSSFEKNQNGNAFNEVIRGIVMPFNSFSSNTRTRIIEDGRKVVYGNNRQKKEAAIDLTGTVAESAAYQAFNVFVLAGIYRFGIKEVLKKVYDIEDDTELYENISNDFKKFRTNVLKELFFSGAGGAIEANGVLLMNMLSFKLQQITEEESGNDFFSWLKEDPTFRPEYQPRAADNFSFMDNLGVYSIPYRTGKVAYDEIRAGVEGVTKSDIQFQKNIKRGKKETDLFGRVRDEIELTEEQKRFYLFMGLLNGMSAISGFNDADIIRAGESLKRGIERKAGGSSSKPAKGGGGMRMGGMGGGMKMGQ
jgi:hypothetical protein